jgi:NADH:ubiquinone oxidoreductase subunit 4 (subunit M)
MIHDQFFNYTPKIYNTRGSTASKISNSIYVLSIKEWNLDIFLKRVFWNPFKFIGNKIKCMSTKSGLIIFSMLFIAGLFFFLFDEHIPEQVDQYLHLLFALCGTIMILLAFVERKDPLKAWLLVIISQCYIVLSVALINDEYQYVEIILYACGLITAAIIGIVILKKLKKAEKEIDLNDFYGHIHHHPKLGFWFLIACLAFVGLPFTPSFIGMDLMFNHIGHHEYALIALTAISFLVLELSVLRIYARLFLGAHKKQTHPIAYRSS